MGTTALEGKSDELIYLMCGNSLDGSLEEAAQHYIVDSERAKNKVNAVIVNIKSEKNNTSKLNIIKLTLLDLAV